LSEPEKNLFISNIECKKIYVQKSILTFYTKNVMNTLEIMYIYVNIFKEETYKRVRLV